MKHLTLKDIIFIMLIALIFGALFVGTDVIYAPLYLVIGPFANEVLFGLWIMAGPLAIAILRLPGTAVIGEVSGFIRGRAPLPELGFLTLRYKNWGWPALISSAFWVTVVSFAYEIFKQGYIHLALPMILALFCTRLVSDLLFGAVLVHYVVRLLVRAHAIQPA
ncbi:ECF transporter S component [Limosilactobacillus fermentum]|nr:ECF transporter S component [Limosilactobacillus fermentum]